MKKLRADKQKYYKAVTCFLLLFATLLIVFQSAKTVATNDSTNTPIMSVTPLSQTNFQAPSGSYPSNYTSSGTNGVGGSNSNCNFGNPYLLGAIQESSESYTSAFTQNPDTSYMNVPNVTYTYLSCSGPSGWSTCNNNTAQANSWLTNAEIYNVWCTMLNQTILWQ